MFDDVLEQVERALDIPYPRRTLVVRELEADLWARYAALRDEGVGEQEARDMALRDLDLDEHSLTSLAELYTPTIRRILLRLPEPAREPAEWLAAGLPLITCIHFIATEVPMLDFMREGGYAMWVILFIGGGAMLLQLRRVFSWFIVRDHSARSLARNTPTPLYLALACFMLGVTATGQGIYVTLLACLRSSAGTDLLMAGIVESLSNISFGGSLAVLIVLFHAAIGAGLRGLQVKQAV